MLNSTLIDLQHTTVPILEFLRPFSQTAEPSRTIPFSFQPPYDHSRGRRRPRNTIISTSVSTDDHNRNCGAAIMPLTTPVLTVDADNIHKVDTANAQSLHGMWMGKFSLPFGLSNVYLG